MVKIVFMGAGSTVFAKNVLGDCMCREALKDSHFALYDINKDRLVESEAVLTALNRNINNGRAKISTYLGVANRKKALKGADFIVNAIQIGGYDPATITDFEVPKKYGLRQTIADTLGIGGIFRGLRTIPVMMDFARDIEEVCPNAWLLSYSNPMAMLTGAVLRGSSVKAVGLCHSVQVCVWSLLQSLEIPEAACPFEEFDHTGYSWKIAGINHMAWLLDVRKDGKDIYPQMRKLGPKIVKKFRGGKEKHGNLVRLEMMNRFGYYVTESSEHNAEYAPYWIKSQYPELVDEYFIPIDEYPRRCVNQINNWKKQYAEICQGGKVDHKLSLEYGSGIINAVVTNTPYQIGGNVLNNGFITNLPANAVVEVPCLVDANGVQGTYVGELPPQCAALNMTNINPQLLTIEAALTLKKEHIYHAAMLDPHTSAELPIDKIVAMCDDLIKAHGDLLPKYK